MSCCLRDASPTLPLARYIQWLYGFDLHAYGPSSSIRVYDVVFVQITCAGELGRLLVDAYQTDQCPTDDEHTARVLSILNDLVDKESAPDSAVRIQVASEGSQIAKGTLKWAKQQVQTLFASISYEGD